MRAVGFHSTAARQGRSAIYADRQCDRPNENILIDLELDGIERQVVVRAKRNGHMSLQDLPHDTAAAGVLYMFALPQQERPTQ